MTQGNHANRRPGRLFLGVVAIAALALAAPAGSQAAYPGSNGRIAFESNVGGADKEIVIAAPDGNGALQLTTNTVDDKDPIWSPDGTKIAFSRFNSGTNHFEIWTMNANGSGQAAVANNASIDYTQATWSPDGARIAFQYQASATNDDIYAVDSGGLNANLTPVVTTSANERNPAWSPAPFSQVVLFSRLNAAGPTPLYQLARRDLSEPVEIIDTVLSLPDHDLTSPSWSPDASTIAFSITGNGNFHDLAFVVANTTSTGPLVVSAASEHNVAWAPEGNELVFDVQNQTGADFELAQVNATDFHQGGMAARPSTVDTNPDWQPVTTAQVRPVGATPMYLPLTVAFKQCTGGNATHNAPLSFNGCTPPQPASPDLTVGEPQVNAKAPNFAGFVKLKALAADTEITVSLSDVRCARPHPGGQCAAPGGALTDYAGGLTLDYGFRLTDRNYGSKAGTLIDTSVVTGIPCTTTPDPAVGSTCGVTTTLNTLSGGGVVVAGRRSSFELTGLEILGPDLLPFAKPGIFQP